MRAYPVTRVRRLVPHDVSSESLTEVPVGGDGAVPLPLAAAVVLSRAPLSTSSERSDDQGASRSSHVHDQEPILSAFGERGTDTDPLATSVGTGAFSGTLASVLVKDEFNCTVCGRGFQRACALARHKRSRVHRRNVAQVARRKRKRDGSAR